MATTIKLKNGSGAPATSDLVQGEPAIDLTNKRLYTENASGAIIEVGSNPSSLSIAGTAVTSTAAELNILDGVTSTAAELNILDGVTSTAAELNILDGVTSTTAELNILDGVTSTTAELNILDGVTSTAAELNILDGVTSTTAELNILDGVTSTTAELNILDGVTSSTAELNILDGVTSTTAELNILDGVTSTATELNVLDGVTAFVDEDNMASDSATSIPSQQSVKAYVDSQVASSDTLAELTDTNITSPADASLLFYDTGTSKWIDNAVSGDITIADTGVAAISSGVIINADVKSDAAIDVSKTALVAGTGITLSTNTLNVDASQTQITAVGTIGTGVWQGTAVADAYVANDLTISGGTVNNTVIGGSTPAAGTFSALVANSLTYPTSDGSNGQAIITNGSGTLSFGDVSGGGGITYVTKTANYTMSAGEGVIANTAGGTFTITLPASPSTGDQVIIADGNAWATTNLTVGRNSSTIEGVAADLVMDVSGISVTMVYDGSTWQLYPQTGTSPSLGIDDNATSTAVTIEADGDVGIGTTSPQEQLHVYTTGTSRVEVESTTNVAGFKATNNQGSYAWYVDSSADKFHLYDFTDSANRLTLDGAGNVGIGTASPAEDLNIVGASGAAKIRFDGDSSNLQNNFIGITGYDDLIIASDEANSGSASTIQFRVDASERMRIDSNGDVGIGIDNPLYKLQVAGATADADGALGSQAPQFSIQGGNANNQFEFGMDNSGATAIGFIQSRNLSAGAQTIALNPAGGSVVVGKAVVDNTTVGCRLNNTGDASFVAHENRPLVLVRKSTSGDHIVFIKDSTTVGAIGDKDADSIYINQGDAGLRFVDGVNTVMPCKENGVVRDNAIDLGTSGNRFNTVYAGTGSINTSDEREKQDIEELTEVETRVAVAAKSLLRKYRWKDMVQAKDDNTRSDETARIHFGIIAQDLKAAFEAEGLDAGRYGMFIHTTWTDEETGEERDRMGIRYSELLAFIIAAI